MASPPAPIAFKRPESVLVVVYTRTGQVLMMKRVDHADFWQSVTGSLEWGEADIAATARRELSEETGIRTANLHDWDVSNRYEIFPEWRYKYRAGVTHNTEHVFSLELPAAIEVTLQPREHSAYEWLDFEAAAERATSWSNRDAIRMIAQMRQRDAAKRRRE